MMMDSFSINLSMFVILKSMISIKGLFHRYLRGFGDRRIIQVTTGYTHCLGLADVNLVSSFTKNNWFLFRMQQSME